VPEILRGGRHADIVRWRRKKQLERTMDKRPDLWSRFEPSDETDRELLKEIEAERNPAPPEPVFDCRRAQEADLPGIMELVGMAQAYLKSQGVDQWQKGYPAPPDILPDIVYHAEGRDPVAYAHLKNYRGEYDPDSMIQLSKAIGTLGGNLLDVVYDATARECWVAYANGPDECAYRRPYVHIRLNDYVPFNATPPNVNVEASYP
jgi:hypothetical protein